MNKIGFMSQLEGLLAEIPAAEREEALQYYNDYFEDAGPENEQSVIKALGSPREIAENIKAELRGEVIPTSAKAGDHAIAKYGQIVPVSEVRDESGNEKTRTAGRTGAPGAGGFGGAGGAGGQGGYGGAGGAGGQGGYGGQGAAGAAAGLLERFRNHDVPRWVWILILIFLICAIPTFFSVVMGIVGTMAGLFISWFALIAAVAVIAFAMIICGVIIIVVAFMCMPVSQSVFLLLLGVGMMCISFGIFMWEIMSGMCDKATPAIFRGMKFVITACVNGMKKLVGYLR